MRPDFALRHFRRRAVTIEDAVEALRGAALSLCPPRPLRLAALRPGGWQRFGFASTWRVGARSRRQRELLAEVLLRFVRVEPGPLVAVSTRRRWAP